MTFPSELENEFRQAFNYFDEKANQPEQPVKKGQQQPVGHPGQLSPKSMRTLLRSMGEDPSDQDLMALCKNSQLCDVNSFIANRKAKWEKANCVDAVKEAFRCFDPEDRGFVSVDQMKRVLTKYGDCLNQNEVEDLCKEANASGGKFNYNEFVETMLQKAT